MKKIFKFIKEKAYITWLVMGIILAILFPLVLILKPEAISLIEIICIPIVVILSFYYYLIGRKESRKGK